MTSISLRASAPALLVSLKSISLGGSPSPSSSGGGVQTSAPSYPSTPSVANPCDQPSLSHGSLRCGKRRGHRTKLHGDFYWVTPASTSSDAFGERITSAPSAEMGEVEAAIARAESR